MDEEHYLLLTQNSDTVYITYVLNLQIIKLWHPQLTTETSN